jgi:signal transduction histidine kinase
VQEAVVLTDREGVVRYWNEAAQKLFWLPENAVLRRRAQDAVPSWSTIAGVVPGLPVRLELPAGERWLVVSSVTFPEGAVFALRDVTEEQALEQARSDFVATASHELRTPLAAVYGAARTLLREDVTLDPVDERMLLQSIANESERLAHIVEQMVLAGQLGAGTIQLVAQPCHVPTLVEDVAASARLRLPEGVDIGTGGPEPFPPVAADEPKLRQVLMNLVDNAIKYSPSGGTVSVRWAKNGRHARIEVEDEGLGIPPEAHERIFEKFYRLDPALTRGVGGSGLGLYICRELVQGMGGRIWVDANDDGGSTFTVELQLA